MALDLPQIVVVGDQSTGKSSLIEGLRYVKYLNQMHSIIDLLLVPSKFHELKELVQDVLSKSTSKVLIVVGAVESV